MLQSMVRIFNLLVPLAALAGSVIAPAFANDNDRFTLKDGALIVTAITRSHKESDFQSYKRLLTTDPARRIQYSSDVTDGYWNLTVTEDALTEAKRYWPYFHDDTTYQSSTALSVSREIWDEIRNEESADFTLYIEENEALFCNGQLNKRGDGEVQLIYDDVVQPVPVIHAELQGVTSDKGSGAEHGTCEASVTILDNQANPVVLRLAAEATGRQDSSSMSVTVVRIESGRPVKNRIRDALLEGEGAAVYGIHFDFNEATIRPDSAPVLQAIAELLEEDPKLALRLEGHTDWIGSDAWNQDLSVRRANSVMSHLVQQFGIAPVRLHAVGFGKSRPVAGSDQTTLVGRAINRRVEVVPMQ